jgi:chromosome segregation ATPase
MSLTKDLKDSYTVLEILVQLKKMFEGIEDIDGLQELYKKVEDKSNEVSALINQNSDINAKNYKQLQDMEVANTILNEKQATIDSSAAALEKKKSELERFENQLNANAKKQEQKQNELNAAAADLETKIAAYNKSIEVLRADQKQMEDYKNSLRVRAEKIKTATEGL